MNIRLQALVGLSIKAGKTVFGVDNIIQGMSKIRLVLYDNTLQPNSISKLTNKLDSGKVKLCLIPYLVEELVFRHSCKAIGITDDNFCSGICRELGIIP